MNILGAISRQSSLFLAGTILLLLSFSVNSFGLGQSQEWFTQFQQKDSAAIIRKTVECKGKTSYSGPLVWETSDEYREYVESSSCSEEIIRPYESQFGLQARMVALFAPSASVNYFRAVEFILSLFLALALMVFVKKVWGIFGPRTGAVVFLLLLLSPWVAAYARNLYWFTFLIFLPFVFSFIAYERLKAKGQLKYFYLILFALIYLKLLDGYEHVSTVMVSSLVPIIFYELQDKKNSWKQLLRPAVSVFVVGVVALGLAIATNIISLNSYYHSWGRATSLVLSRAEDRASQIKQMQPYVIGGFEATLPAMYHYIDVQYDLDRYKDGEAHLIKYVLLSILNYSLLPAISLPFVLKEPIHTIIESILFIGIISYLSILSVSKKKGFSRYKRSLIFSYWLSLAGALSWLIMMPAHAFPHAHINAIIFYLPFLLVCYIGIGLWISSLGFWRRYGKS